jgi:Ca2+-binding RTX toxin-like protein
VVAAGRSLGTNLAGIAQWSTQSPFIDHFKSARTWLPQEPNVWDTGESALLDLDVNGWLRSLPAAGSQAQFDVAGTLVLPYGVAARPGRYVILYEGEGQINYGLGGRKLVGESTPGRDVVQLVNQAGNPALGNDPNQLPIYLQISQTNPQNYLRNFQVIHEDDLALYEAGIVFQPEFLENIKNYGSLRFMDWMNTNAIWTPQEWNSRPRPDQATWMTNGVPVETMVALANTTGTNPWFTIPHLATDDYIRQFATYVRDHLAPGLVAYVEFSNEVWNFQFPQTAWAYDQGIANLTDVNGNPPAAPNIQWYGVRAAQTANIWREVFAAKPGAPELKTVFSTQSAWQGLEYYGLEAPAWVAKGNRPPKESFDVYATAPYVGSHLGLPENQTLMRQWAQEGEAGMVKAFQELRTGGLLGTAGVQSLQQAQLDIAYHKSVATVNGMSLAAYEFGQHVAGVYEVQNDPILTEFFIRLNRDPRMGELYTDYLNVWKQAGGSVAQNFSDVYEPSKFGSWGLLESWNQVSSPKYDAVQNFLNSNPRWWSDGTPNQAVGLYLRGTANADILTGTLDSDTLLGGAGNDRLQAGTGNVSDYLNGETGNDQMEGGAGDDHYVVDSLGDVIVELANAGKDTVNSVISYSLANTNLEDLYLLGTASINGLGNGFNNRLVGNAGNNSLSGGDGNDFLWGDTGNDTLNGESGNDILVGDIGADSLDGGLDDDYILGGADNDVLLGGAGNDSLNGEAGNDNLSGNAGNDILAGDIGTDTINGGEGNDYLLGGADNDLLNGEAGNNTLSGEAGADSLTGGDGNDVLLGDIGADTINAGDGDDYVLGGGDNDLLNGGAGNDLMNSEGGNDTLNGDAGNDILAGDVGADSLDGGLDDDYILGGADNDVLLGGAGNDSLNGEAGNDNLDGNAGNDILGGDVGADTINGGEGNDYLLGGADNDLLNGEAGSNTLLGEAGADSLTGGDGNDVLLGDIGADTINGGDGDDYVLGGGDNDLLNGGAGNDLMNSEGGNDTLNGDAGNDILAGDVGADSLNGGLGDDYILGGADNDVLLGGAGDDILVGGVGNDELIFGSVGLPFANLGVDTITDFALGDKLVLSKATFTALTSSVGSGLSVGSEFATVTSAIAAETSSALIVYNSTDRLLYYNTNGTVAGFGVGGAFAYVSTNPTLAASSFSVIA